MNVQGLARRSKLLIGCIVPALSVFASIDTPSAARSTPTIVSPVDSARAADLAALALYRDIGLGRGSRANWEKAARLWLDAAELYGRTGDSATQADRLLRVVRCYAWLGQPDSTLKYATAARTIGLRIVDQSNSTLALSEIARSLYGTAVPADSLARMYRGMAAAYHDRGDSWNELAALNRLAGIYDSHNHADSARVIQQAAATRLQHVLTARRLIAFAAGTQVSIVGSRASLDSALGLSRQVADRVGEEQALALIGAIQSALGGADSALFYYAQALAIATKSGDRAGQRSVAGAMQGELDSPPAPDDERYPWDASGEAGILAGMGRAHEAQGDTAAAAAELRRALTLARQTLDPQLELAVSYDLMQLHSAARRPDSAAAYAQNMLWVQEKIGDKYAGDWEGYRAGALGELAMIAIAKGQPDSARAIAANAKTAIKAVSASRRFPAYRRLGDVHRRLGTRADLAAAGAYYDSAVMALSDAVQDRTNKDVDRILLVGQNERVYGDRLLTWLAQQHSQTISSDFAASALALNEQGLAIALRNLMQVNGQMSPFPNALRDSLGIAKAGSDLSALLKYVHMCALEYAVTSDTLVVWLATSSGSTTLWRRAISSDSVAILVANLRESLGVDGPAAGASRRIPVLEKASATRGTSPRRNVAAQWRADAENLAAVVIPPSIRELIPAGEEVIIVPQGVLGMVPFAVLPVRDTTPLGAIYALSYAPSLATFEAADDSYGKQWALPPERFTFSQQENDAWFAARHHEQATRDVFVLANPAMPSVDVGSGRRAALPSLPGAETEAKAIAALLGTKPLIGAGASESALRSRIAKASIVHLATHGYAYSARSRFRDSFIALAAGDRQDGLLTVGEVMDELPPLSAELIVLSACQTGLGNLQQAEGTLGLQRAFLSRGVRSVLVSLWSVDDDATARLMRAFYTHWLQDADRPHKAIALARAQDELRADPHFVSPRVWAAFQLVGGR